MRIGLYFGSFNPIHNGHLIIAQFMYNTGLFDKIRFVVSPQNPFKKESELMDDTLRLDMVTAAIAGNSNFEVSDTEYHLAKPSFTIDTLNKFWEQESENTFSILLGSDNLAGLRDWKNIEEISEICDFHVYARPGTETQKAMVLGEFTYHNAPYIDISATYIRQLLKDGKSLNYLVPHNILSYLQS